MKGEASRRAELARVRAQGAYLTERCDGCRTPQGFILPAVRLETISFLHSETCEYS